MQMQSPTRSPSIGNDPARHASYFRNAPSPVRQSGQITGSDVSFDLATGVVWKLHEPSRNISLTPGESGPVVGEGRIHTVGDDGDLGHLGKTSLSPQRGQAVRCSEWARLYKVTLLGHATVEYGRRIPEHGSVGRDPKVSHAGGDHAARTRDPAHLGNRGCGVGKNVQNQRGDDCVKR